MLPEPLKSRYRVDVIDFRHCMDGKYKFVLVCEHDVTKFVTLKALESDEVDEVASSLLDIFLLFGAPCILQSQKGRDFCKKLIEELEILWPEVRMVDGKITNTDVQDNEEPAFRGIPKMLTKWMEIQNCTSWSSVLKFIQCSRNSTFCPLIGKTPHEAMFGCTASVGLGTYLPEDAIHDIFSEEDLENVLSKRNVAATEQRCQIVIQTDNQNTLATFYVDAPLFVNQDTLSVNENFLLFNENLVSVNENILSVNENTISVNDNPISVNSNSLPMSENILSVNENILAVNENTLSVNENTLPVNENTLPINENTLPLNENTLQVNEIPLQVNEIGPVEQPLPNENTMQLSGIQDKWGELLMEAGISEDQSWDKEYDVDLMDISAIIKDENPAHEVSLDLVEWHDMCRKREV